MARKPYLTPEGRTLWIEEDDAYDAQRDGAIVAPQYRSRREQEADAEWDRYSRQGW